MTSHDAFAAPAPARPARSRLVQCAHVSPTGRPCTEFFHQYQRGQRFCPQKHAPQRGRLTGLAEKDAILTAFVEHPHRFRDREFRTRELSVRSGVDVAKVAALLREFGGPHYRLVAANRAESKGCWWRIVLPWSAVEMLQATTRLALQADHGAGA